MARQEITHEIEARIEYTSAKSRLIEDNFTGERYWLPKKCTIDFNQSGSEDLFLIVVSDWWWKKRHEFTVEDK